jgi:hypothetical protein
LRSNYPLQLAGAAENIIPAASAGWPGREDDAMRRRFVHPARQERRERRWRSLSEAYKRLISKGKLETDAEKSLQRRHYRHLLYWFKTRHDWLEGKNYVAAFPATEARRVPHPHLLIALFRQEAMSQILLRNASEAEVAKVRRLFPGAEVVSGNWGAPSLGDPVHIGKRALPD